MGQRIKLRPPQPRMVLALSLPETLHLNLLFPETLHLNHAAQSRW